MRASLVAVCAAALCLSVGGPAAQACEGNKVLFEDEFARLDPTWGEADASFFVDKGMLELVPDPDAGYYALNNSGYYTDVDYCVDVIAVNADLSGNSYAGAIFWGLDEDNYYSVVISADGYAAALRKRKGASVVQADWAQFGAIKRGMDAVNQVRVVTAGNRATLYVNGSKFKTITGAPPEDGWRFGVRAASPKNSRATYGFDNVKLTIDQ